MSPTSEKLPTKWGEKVYEPISSQTGWSHCSSGLAKSHGRIEWKDPALARGTEEGFLWVMAFEIVLGGSHNLVF